MRNRSTRAAKAREFSQQARDEIYHRDAGECIFCAREYEMEGITWFEKHLLSGSRGKREEMLCIFREHMKSKYQDWNEEDLTWNKWRKG